MVKLAFNKGSSIFDKAIKLWTVGSYSHVEIIIDDVMFSSVPGIGTRYLLYPYLASEDWVYVDISLDKEAQSHVWNWCMSEMGCPYDWNGLIFSQVFGLRRSHPHKWFCSEFCTAALRIGGLYKNVTPEAMSPNSLYKAVSKS